MHLDSSSKFGKRWPRFVQGSFFHWQLSTSLSVGIYRPAVLLDPAGNHHRAVRMLHLFVQNQAAQIIRYLLKAEGARKFAGQAPEPQKPTDKPVSRLQPGLQQYPPVK